MPIYANSTHTDIYFEGVRVPAMDTVTVGHFMTALPVGVTKVSDTPCYNPFFGSTVYSGSSGSVTIALPTAGDFSVRVRCSAGAATLEVNSAGVTPNVKLIAGEQMEFMVRNGTMYALVLTYTAASSIVKVDLSAPGSVSWDL